MNTTVTRVGVRQWRALREAEDAYPNSVSYLDMCKAIADGMSPSFARPVVDSLLDKGLIEHVCVPPDHVGSITKCRYQITERGALARLGRGQHGAYA